MIAEAVTFVVCVVLALVLMVMVARKGWPPWWLMVAGMLTAWAGDALWTLGEHLVAGLVARVRVRRHTTPGGPRLHDPGPAAAHNAIGQWHRHHHRHRHGHEYGRRQDVPPPPGSDR